jgi:hypothetical protein
MVKFVHDLLFFLNVKSQFRLVFKIVNINSLTSMILFSLQNFQCFNLQIFDFNL